MSTPDCALVHGCETHARGQPGIEQTWMGEAESIAIVKNVASETRVFPKQKSRIAGSNHLGMKGEPDFITAYR